MKKALMIGTFDGVHLGHQHLLQELQKHGQAIVITFSNHPLEILNPAKAPKPILTLDEKVSLLKTHGADSVLVLPFTEELARTHYETFLTDLHMKLSFTTLVGGEDIRLGYQGKGDAAHIHTLSQTLGFKTYFLPKLQIDGETISSRRIRELIEQKQFDQAQKYLGHNVGSLWLDSLVVS